MYVEKKLGELDAELNRVKLQRNDKQRTLKSVLKKNRDEQEQLQERLRQLVNQDKDLTAKIEQNDKFQADADQVFHIIYII